MPCRNTSATLIATPLACRYDAVWYCRYYIKVNADSSDYYLNRNIAAVY